jgi:predicted lipoprotein with Yx(FWY)xxD motif
VSRLSRSMLSAVVAAALAGCGTVALPPMGGGTATAPVTRMAGPAKVADGVLVGTNGMTLYTFDRDVAGSGKSVCTGPCAANWPPLMAAADARPSGDWTVINRDDGGRQWAYKGRPLYFWAKDAKPGDRTGDGFNNVWRVARP